jgi:hypothetical protein
MDMREIISIYEFVFDRIYRIVAMKKVGKGEPSNTVMAVL